jgi:cyclophilin family peptidyl-prolyl cis-trans isomerase
MIASSALDPSAVNGARQRFHANAVRRCACLAAILALIGGSGVGAQQPRAQRYVRTLAPEFNGTPHVKGIVSMARTDDPNSASTSFFICTGPAPSLDGKYTAFGQVVDGLATVEMIDAAPVEGETPRERLEVTKVTVTSD